MFEFLAGLFSNALKDMLNKRLQAALDALKKKDPERHALVVTSLYPVIDVELENITDKTKTKVDDVLVDGLKGALEESAASAGLTLPNLDSD